MTQVSLVSWYAEDYWALHLMCYPTRVRMCRSLREKSGAKWNVIMNENLTKCSVTCASLSALHEASPSRCFGTSASSIHPLRNLTMSSAHDDDAAEPLLSPSTQSHIKLHGDGSLHIQDSGRYTYAYGPPGVSGLLHSRYTLGCVAFASLGGLTFGA